VGGFGLRPVVAAPRVEVCGEEHKAAHGHRGDRLTGEDFGTEGGLESEKVGAHAVSGPAPNSYVDLDVFSDPGHHLGGVGEKGSLEGEVDQSVDGGPLLLDVVTDFPLVLRGRQMNLEFLREFLREFLQLQGRHPNWGLW